MKKATVLEHLGFLGLIKSKLPRFTLFGKMILRDCFYVDMWLISKQI